MGKLIRVLLAAEVLGAHPGGGQCYAWAIHACMGSSRRREDHQIAECLQGTISPIWGTGRRVAVVRGRARCLGLASPGLACSSGVTCPQMKELRRLKVSC